MFGAVSATVNRVILFDTVAHDFAHNERVGCKGVNGAFKGIEHVFFATRREREGFVVFIAALFTR